MTELEQKQKELEQLRKKLAHGNHNFATPSSPHYHRYVESLRHNAKVDDKVVAVCCPQSGTYCFIHVPNPNLQPVLLPQMTFENFEQLIHPSDALGAIGARMMAYQLGEGLAADERKNYALAFDCRIRHADGRYYRTILRYTVDIIGVEHGDSLLLLQLLPFSKKQCNEPSQCAVIVNIYDRTVVCSNEKYQITSRELEVLRLVNENFSSKEIAQMLFLSRHTVDNHRGNILDKTNTVDTYQAFDFLSKMVVI
jgi:DNA-binding CsgD family transcriptional regulator